LHFFVLRQKLAFQNWIILARFDKGTHNYSSSIIGRPFRSTCAGSCFVVERSL
jgi:hypothetical protein